MSRLVSVVRNHTSTVTRMLLTQHQHHQRQQHPLLHTTTNNTYTTDTTTTTDKLNIHDSVPTRLKEILEEDEFLRVFVEGEDV